MFDCIEIGIYFCVVVVIGGDIWLLKIFVVYLDIVVDKLMDVGCEIIVECDVICLVVLKCLKVVSLCMVLYLVFLIDMQVQFMVINCVVDGVFIICEIIFENWFMYVSELMCLGVDIQIEGNNVIVCGIECLEGVIVMVIDLCVLVLLVIVGLVVQGEMLIDCIYYFDCGYEWIEEKFVKLGVCVKWVY